MRKILRHLGSGIAPPGEDAQGSGLSGVSPRAGIGKAIVTSNLPCDGGMISCHTLGAFSCNGAVKTIVDIGGQDVKGIAQCSVFAETEVISLLVHNNPPADIAAGIQLVVAKRCFTLLKRVGIRPHVTVSRSLSTRDCYIF